MINNTEILPLSWTIGSQINKIKKAEMFNTVWFSLAELNSTSEFIDEIRGERIQHGGILIRGCNAGVFNGKLRQLGFKFYPVGSEAVLSTEKNLFDKKSLKELVRRGNRFGNISEYNFSTINQKKYERLLRNSPHSNEPKLRDMYRVNLDSTARIFVMENGSEYLGLISISLNNEDKYQAELLLRESFAPIGVMEALVYFIHTKLKHEGIKYFSLGEVPFVIKQSELHNPLAVFVNKVGRGLRFAYNYKGLYNFKNKFMPEWQDVYLATYPKLSLPLLLNIFFNSDLHRLVLYKAIH